MQGGWTEVSQVGCMTLQCISAASAEACHTFLRLRVANSVCRAMLTAAAGQLGLGETTAGGRAATAAPARRARPSPAAAGAAPAAASGPAAPKRKRGGRQQLPLLAQAAIQACARHLCTEAMPLTAEQASTPSWFQPASVSIDRACLDEQGLKVCVPQCSRYLRRMPACGAVCRLPQASAPDLAYLGIRCVRRE